LSQEPNVEAYISGNRHLLGREHGMSYKCILPTSEAATIATKSSGQSRTGKPVVETMEKIKRPDETAL
jgi:hypothetical protein